MTNELFLPSIHSGGPSIAPQADPVQAFIDAWMQLLGSHANVMRRHDLLTHCAMQHASFLAHRTPEQERYSMHIGMGASMPNQRILWAGYRLPGYYAPNKNNTESCARDPRDPATVCLSLAAHDTHYNHMHCINGFERQTCWGIGHMGDDWVVLTAPPPEA